MSADTPAGILVKATRPLVPIMVRLIFGGRETDEQFEERCRAVVQARRDLRAHGVTIPAPDAWEREVGARMDAER